MQENHREITLHTGVINKMTNVCIESILYSCFQETQKLLSSKWEEEEEKFIIKYYKILIKNINFLVCI